MNKKRNAFFTSGTFSSSAAPCTKPCRQCGGPLLSAHPRVTAVCPVLLHTLRRLQMLCFWTCNKQLHPHSPSAFRSSFAGHTSLPPPPPLSLLFPSAVPPLSYLVPPASPTTASGPTSIWLDFVFDKGGAKLDAHLQALLSGAAHEPTAADLVKVFMCKSRSHVTHSDVLMRLAARVTVACGVERLQSTLAELSLEDIARLHEFMEAQPPDDDGRTRVLCHTWTLMLHYAQSGRKSKNGTCARPLPGKAVQAAAESLAEAVTPPVTSAGSAAAMWALARHVFLLGAFDQAQPLFQALVDAHPGLPPSQGIPCVAQLQGFLLACAVPPAADTTSDDPIAGALVPLVPCAAAAALPQAWGSPTLPLVSPSRGVASSGADAAPPIAVFRRAVRAGMLTDQQLSAVAPRRSASVPPAVAAQASPAAPTAAVAPAVAASTTAAVHTSPARHSDAAAAAPVPALLHPAANGHAASVCQVCGVSTREDAMLLCDGCDKGFHVFCLTPPLAVIPEGDWFCTPCLKNKFAYLAPAAVGEAMAGAGAGPSAGAAAKPSRHNDALLPPSPFGALSHAAAAVSVPAGLDHAALSLLHDALNRALTVKACMVRAAPGMEPPVSYAWPWVPLWLQVVTHSLLRVGAAVQALAVAQYLPATSPVQRHVSTAVFAADPLAFASSYYDSLWSVAALESLAERCAGTEGQEDTMCVGCVVVVLW